MLHTVDNIKESTAASWQWLLRVRSASPGQPNFVFFPHAGATPLSIGRMAAVLPGTAGVVVAVLPRGGNLDHGTPPTRATDAAQCIARSLANMPRNESRRLVLVGNSYGALLAYETAWCLVDVAHDVERLIVSGFRSPALPLADIPLHRLPSAQLYAELAARFGVPLDAGAELAEPALRADLQACDTYRHRHGKRLPVPLDVLHLTDDSSVSVAELQAWQSVSCYPVRLTPCASGHFPWAGNPELAARALLGLTTNQGACH
ncbi:alpha/beta fold hydrolase [Pusillimonas sp. MFBS29]|uniref:thioesterase II family protein n=1 Tax=Pusillimonas sp. MFBS29 TaxID=2886690 RepID=UPI001D128F08|nr:alpha/beta fold hydrolase [Pusillimonas sp. MFBS29]MCC2597580.1 alpha/beta fold hydrolase [Pusillimonas sp. MFBS29]